MEIRFVKKAGQRDRCWVTRDDGSQASWQFPSYGDALPHDLVHFIVERAFGIERGLWGLVASGVDIAKVNEAANRGGGADKYAALGDLKDLLTAEALATVRWGEATAFDIAAACAGAGVDGPTVDGSFITEVRAQLDELLTRWRALGDAGTVLLRWG